MTADPPCLSCWPCCSLLAYFSRSSFLAPPPTLRGVFAHGDLAVAQLYAARLRAATYADSSSVRVGDYALAIGNPLRLRSSVTQGIVSAPIAPSERGRQPAGDAADEA